MQTIKIFGKPLQRLCIRGTAKLTPKFHLYQRLLTFTILNCKCKGNRTLKEKSWQTKFRFTTHLVYQQGRRHQQNVFDDEENLRWYVDAATPCTNPSPLCILKGVDALWTSCNLVCMLLKPMPFGKCAISNSKRQVKNGQIDCDVFHGQDFYATLYNFFP